MREVRESTRGRSTEAGRRVLVLLLVLSRARLARARSLSLTLCLWAYVCVHVLLSVGVGRSCGGVRPFRSRCLKSEVGLAHDG